MTTPTSFLEQWKRDEGLSLRLIPDAHDTWQIGYGHNLSRRGVPQEIADRLAEIDCQEAVAECATLASYAALSPPRQAVLAGLCANMGFAGLLGFHLMLGHVALAQWSEAAAELRNSAADHEEPARIERWARQLESGNWT